MGAHVTALPLTRKAGNTQGDSATTAAHPDQRRDITLLNIAAGLSPKGYPSIAWVAAHLLSARLHGPNPSGNFTPTTQHDNTVLRRAVEEPALRLLAANEGRNMLWWDAEVKPRSEAALAHWADTLTVTYGAWDAAKPGGRGAAIKSVAIRPRPDFSGARTIGSLSEDGADRLAAVTGMDPDVARTIVEVREARLGPGGRFRSPENAAELVVATGRTIGGQTTRTLPEETLRELDRLRNRIVPYFGFDPDADIMRFVEVMRWLHG